MRNAVMEAVGNPVGVQVARLEARLSLREDERGARAQHAAYPSPEARRAKAEARMKGYEGDACGACGNFTLVRNGTCMKCNTCGSTSGCS